jgi:hypothetical protein
MALRCGSFGRAPSVPAFDVQELPSGQCSPMPVVAIGARVRVFRERVRAVRIEGGRGEERALRRHRRRI